MSTETTSIEDMLESDVPLAREPVPQESTPPTEIQTGDNASAAPPADAEAVHDDAPSVPRKAYQDERRKRQDLERRLAELERSVVPPAQQQTNHHQQQGQPPVITEEDLERLWWENPAQAAAIIRHHAAAEAAQHATLQAQVAMLSRDLERSKRRALKTHSQEIIEAAEQEALKMRKEADFFDEEDPYEALVSWYNDLQAARDPKSLKERLRAELMAEMGISTPNSPAPAKTQAPVPRSLATAASAQPRDDRGRFAGLTPIEELIP